LRIISSEKLFFLRLAGLPASVTGAHLKIQVNPKRFWNYTIIAAALNSIKCKVFDLSQAMAMTGVAGTAL
jgi:hypothetical protein